MTLFSHQFHLLVWVLFLAVVIATDPQPGDAINWTIPFPQWWHDIKDQYKLREVRKCEFLEFVPNTGDHCPGVSRQGHYYCIYGNETRATWFCTCIERTGDFVFHCATELRTVDTIEAMLNATSDPPAITGSNPPRPPTNPPTGRPTTLQQGSSSGGSGSEGVVTINGPLPGDPINWTIPFSEWWHTIKDQYELREIRKCEFLENIPNTGDHCPGVSRKDHYYCVYGDTTHATWFCTCVETGIAQVDEYVFQCANKLLTVADIKALEEASANPGVTIDQSTNPQAAPAPATNPPTSSTPAINPPTTTTASKQPANPPADPIPTTTPGGTSDQPAVSTVSSQQEPPAKISETDTNGSFAGGFWAGAAVMAGCMIALSAGKRYYKRTTMMKQRVADDDPDQGIVWERRINLNIL